MKNYVYFILVLAVVFLLIKIFWPLIVLFFLALIALKLYSDYKHKKWIEDLEHQTQQESYNPNEAMQKDVIDVEFRVKEEHDNE